MTSETESDSGEYAVLALSTHWVKYVPPTVIYLLLFPIGMAFFVIAALNAHEYDGIANIFFVGALVLLFMVHHWYFHKIMSEAMVDLVVTNQRVIFCQDSLLRFDDLHEFSLNNLIAVEAKKHGIIQNLLRYGSLWIDTGGSSSTDRGAMIPLIPHPHYVAQQITALHRAGT